MSGYITESFRYFEIAEKSLNNFDDNKNAYVCIVFSAMYIEGIINDLIFSEKLYERLLAEYKNVPLDDYYDFDLYQDKVSFDAKLNVIFDKYSFNDFSRHKEYIELKHLISIRNSLVHLKPLEQNDDGISKIKISKSALNYLYKSLGLISSPFDIGVYWSDTLLNNDVAEWSINVAKQSIEYLFNATFKTPFGNYLLDFHMQRLKIGKWKNK